MLYFGSPTSGNTINSVPENVEKINLDEASQIINIGGASEPNTLILNENAPFEAYIDYDNNNGGTFNGRYYLRFRYTWLERKLGS